MNCNQIVQELAERGIWSSPNGKTPGATLYAAANSEIRKKGAESRFVCEGKGQFKASEHGIAVFKAAQEAAATA